jgi:endonuclease III
MTQNQTPPKRLRPSKRRSRSLTRDGAERMFEALSTHRPAPKTELEFRDAYTLLVAVALSAQATDVSVNKATAVLFEKAATPQAMVALGAEGVEACIRTIGLYRNKAKNVIALSEMLIQHHGGEVPRDRAALEALPGVGRKTANVVLNVMFGEPTLAVDTHVFRVANRTGLARGTTPLSVEMGLLKIIPEAYLADAHHWLILHGRYICKARAPLCGQCPIADICLFEEKSPQ